MATDSYGQNKAYINNNYKDNKLIILKYNYPYL